MPHKLCRSQYKAAVDFEQTGPRQVKSGRKDLDWMVGDTGLEPVTPAM